MNQNRVPFGNQTIYIQGSNASPIPQGKIERNPEKVVLYDFNTSSLTKFDPSHA
jgi:hypothetical protein